MNTTIFILGLTVLVLLVIIIYQSSAVRKAKANVKEISAKVDHVQNSYNKAELRVTMYRTNYRQLLELFIITVDSWNNLLIKKYTNRKGNYKQMKLIPNKKGSGYQIREISPQVKDQLMLEIGFPDFGSLSGKQAHKVVEVLHRLKRDPDKSLQQVLNETRWYKGK